MATERVYPVSVLPLPDPKADATAIARSDAVQLFVDRARQHRPNFDLQEQRAGAVAAICVRLDGIPLALELAAARVAVLPVDQIVRLLDQRFRLLVSGNRELPRQQTLRAMIDWSHELLDAAEQQLFARLSVFAGGWTIAAAEIVGAGEAIAKDDVVYLLIALIEKSLVVADEDGDRYRMLETVREYARQKLAESGSAELVRERHRDYFLALAKESEPNLVGPEQAKWLQRLEAEHDNLRAALEWTLAAAVTVEGLRFCGVLQRFWVARGHFSEGRGFCVRALQMEDSGGPTPERAKTLNAAGVLAFFQGDYPTAWACHEESLAIRQQLCDRGGAASSFNNLGIVAYFQGEFPVARKMYEEALVIQRELGNQRAVANALGNLGSLAQGQQDFAAARALYEECLAIMRDLGDLGGIAAALGDLGTVIALSHGDLQAARRLYEECMAIYRELGNQRGIGNTLINLGDLAYEQGDFHAVAPFHRESLAIFHAMGDTRGIDNSLRGIAAGVAALGNSIHAARIWGAAGRLRDETGAPLPPSERPRYDRHVAAAKAALGDDAAFDRAWADGQALTQAQAFELALHDKVEER